jgi:PST family polysaccharide transporter
VTVQFKLKKLLPGKVIENVIALYAVQACTYLLPLITFPYLARTLGPKGWGAVLFSQAIGALIAIVVEYGFDFSATRETARFINDKARLSRLVSGVLGAKAMLAAVCIIGAVIARPLTRHIADSPALFWSSTIWGIAQGINMLWYFQGQERMRLAGALDVGGKAVATVSIFWLVHNPADGWKVMAAQALGCVVAHGITVVIAFCEVGVRLPSLRYIWDALKVGWSLFLFRGSQSLLTSVNGIVLGVFASPVALGLYVGADKIGQVSRQSLWPLTQALFPHQVKEVRTDPKQAVRTVWLSFKILGGLGICSGLVLVFAAPLLIRLALGPSFHEAEPTLRILGALTPLTALASVFGFQWMLPRGMDRQFNFVIFTAGLLHVVIASVLTWLMGSMGMAIAVVCSQFYIVAFFTILFRQSLVNPFPPHIAEPAEEVAPNLEIGVVSEL